MLVYNLPMDFGLFSASALYIGSETTTRLKVLDCI